MTDDFVADDFLRRCAELDRRLEEHGIIWDAAKADLPPRERLQWAAQQTRDALRIFRGLVDELPPDAPSLPQLVALLDHLERLQWQIERDTGA